MDIYNQRRSYANIYTNPHENTNGDADTHTNADTYPNGDADVHANTNARALYEEGRGSEACRVARPGGVENTTSQS